MKLIIANDLLKILPEFHVYAYLISFSSCALDKTKEVDVLLEDIYKSYPLEYDYSNITKDLKLKESRDGYKILGKDPSHTRLASEALLRRVVKGEKLYRLGDVIDLGNVLSLKTKRSVCVVDADKIVGDVKIRIGNKEDNYEGIGRGMINVTSIPVYTDDFGPFGCPTSDTLRTMVTEETKNILVMLICFFSNHDDRQDEKLLIELYEKYIKCEKIIHISEERQKL